MTVAYFCDDMNASFIPASLLTATYWCPGIKTNFNHGFSSDPLAPADARPALSDDRLCLKHHSPSLSQPCSQQAALAHGGSLQEAQHPFQPETCSSTSHFISIPEFALFVTEFTTLITALEPQLARLGSKPMSSPSSSISRQEESPVWKLWDVLVASYTSLHEAALGVCPISNLPYYPSLVSAFHDTLTWLLHFSRSPEWLALQPERIRSFRSGQLALIMFPPSSCLLDLCSKISFHKFTLVPPSLLPNLCCIVAEEYGNIPPLISPAHPTAAVCTRSPNSSRVHSERVYGFLGMFADLLNGLADMSLVPSNYLQLSVLTAPAVLQAVKVILILPRGKMRACLDFVNQCIGSLDILLHMQPVDHSNTADFPSDPLSLSNMDALGLPLHLNPRLSKPALETDRRLLHALGLHTQEDISLLPACYSVQNMILSAWVQPTTATASLNKVALPLMLQSVTGLAKQCMQHGLHFVP